MAKVYDFLEIMQDSHNLCATQKEFHAQNKQMTVMWYIFDTGELVNALWSNVQHDSAAAFKLLERSPVAPDMSANNLLGGRNQVLNISSIKIIDPHPAECEEDSALASISDTQKLA